MWFKKLLIVSSSVLLISFALGFPTAKADDKENYWVWDLGQGQVAYNSLAEDIRFGKEINAMKRAAGGESAGFPKISISTEMYAKIKDTWEKNGQDFIRNYKGLTWPAGRPAHTYNVTTDPPGTNRMQGNNVEILHSDFDAMSIEYFGEVHNITAAGGPSNYGHSISLLAAETMGSIFVQEGGTGGPFPVNRHGMFFSTTFITTSATDMWVAGSKWMTASQQWYQDPGKVKSIISGATDEDTPKVDNKDVEKTSQADTKSFGIDSTGTAWKFSEDMIPNMPKDRDFKDDVTTMKFLTPAKFDTNETVSVVKWQEEVEDNLVDSSIKTTRIWFMVFGMIFVIIGGLLILFYTFDRWAWGISSLSFVSGGRVRLTDGSEKATVIMDGGKKVRIVNFTDIVTWSAIFTLVGVLVMSGQIYQFLLWLSSTIKWFKF